MTARRFAALVAAGAACLAATGCGTWQTSEPITPTSYQTARAGVPRSVGKLRRMAVLQVGQGAQKACGGAEDVPATLQAASPELLGELLARRKGYEVMVPDAERYARWLQAPGSAGFVGEVMQWPATVDSFEPGPLTRALLEHLRRADQVDGLLILRVQNTCENAFVPFRGLLAIGSLGISELWPDPRLREIYKAYQATVFETSSAHVVWRSAQSSANLKLINWLNMLDSSASAPSDMEHLFDGLEPAVPKILTR